MCVQIESLHYLLKNLISDIFTRKAAKDCYYLGKA